MHSVTNSIFVATLNWMLAMQCRSRRDAFLAAMVDVILEVIDVLVLLAWRVALGPIDRYASFDGIYKVSL